MESAGVKSDRLWLITWLQRNLKLHRFVVPDIDHFGRACHDKLLAETHIKSCNLARVERRAQVLKDTFLDFRPVKIDGVDCQELFSICHKV